MRGEELLALAEAVVYFDKVKSSTYRRPKL